MAFRLYYVCYIELSSDQTDYFLRKGESNPLVARGGRRWGAESGTFFLSWGNSRIVNKGIKGTLRPL